MTQFSTNDYVFVEPIKKLLPGKPHGFAVLVLDLLGPGDPDAKGNRRTWMAGLVCNTAPPKVIKLLLPDDQPLATRNPGGLLSPPAGWKADARDPHPFEGIVPPRRAL